MDRALKCRSATQDDSNLDAAIYRGMVINAFFLNEQQRLLNTFSIWFKEYPSDANATSEWQRISVKFGLSVSDLDLPSGIFESQGKPTAAN